MTATLVLLPGLDGTGDLFDDFVAVLPPRTPVRVGRYPPEEFLSYRQLLPFVKELTADLNQFVVLGESFSSVLAIMLAAENPANLAAVILCAGFASNPFPRMGWAMRALAKPWLFRLQAPDWLLDHYIFEPSTPVRLKKRIDENLRRVSPEVLAGRAREILDCDVRAELAEIRVPMLYLQSAKDRLIKARCLEEIAKVRPDVQLSSIPAPHLVMQSQPYQCAEIILEFCTSIAGRR
jgi:pimeloyl-[acyl-carrier protein] methyl ester esterase